MIKLGLIGYPLAHSLSPAMHKAALNKLGLEGDYVLLETRPEKLGEQVNYIKSSGFNGFNVTIPHKVKIMEFLDETDEFAQKIGAVNTVVIGKDKKLSGYNTDVYGFIHAIPQGVREGLKGKKAVITGSGGAARALVAGIFEMELKELEIFTLGVEMPKAEEIKTQTKLNFPALKVKCSELNEKINLADVSLVVNATPVGMEGKFEGMSPLSEHSLNSLPENAFVYDIVYKPQETKLLQLAKQRGLQTLCGLDMLMLQGARGFQLWTGQEPPLDVMKQVLLNGV